MYSEAAFETTAPPTQNHGGRKNSNFGKFNFDFNNFFEGFGSAFHRPNRRDDPLNSFRFTPHSMVDDLFGNEDLFSRGSDHFGGSRQRSRGSGMFGKHESRESQSQSGSFGDGNHHFNQYSQQYHNFDDDIFNGNSHQKMYSSSHNGM